MTLAMGTPMVLRDVLPGPSTICGNTLGGCRSEFEVEETKFGALCSHCAALFAPIRVEHEDGRHHTVDRVSAWFDADLPLSA